MSAPPESPGGETARSAESALAKPVEWRAQRCRHCGKMLGETSISGALHGCSVTFEFVCKASKCRLPSVVYLSGDRTPREPASDQFATCEWTKLRCRSCNFPFLRAHVEGKLSATVRVRMVCPRRRCQRLQVAWLELVRSAPYTAVTEGPR